MEFTLASKSQFVILFYETKKSTKKVTKIQYQQKEQKKENEQ